MDAEYLKLNVFDALTEALAAMSAAVPDDKVEFLSKYLLAHVERKKLLTTKKSDNAAAEKEYEKELRENAAAAVVALEKEREADEEKAKFRRFLDGFQAVSTNKEVAMANVTDFISSYLEIPAVYVALKKTIGENEFLYFSGANRGQEFLIGKKILKYVYDPEDPEAPARQGVSFECFKVPEVPESDEPEEDEDGNPIPKPPPPVPQPLIIENVMRDKRVKFFGIPKLGSYVAIPFSYQSLDHENGLLPRPPVEETPEGVTEEKEPTEDDEADKDLPPTEPIVKSPYVQSKVTQDVMIGIDNIGKYKAFTPEQIFVVQQLGTELLEVFQSLEKSLIDKQVDFLDGQKSLSEQVAQVLAKTADEETQLLSAPEPVDEPAPIAPVEPAPPAVTDDGDGEEKEAEDIPEPPPPPPESYKPSILATKVLGLWQNLFQSEEVVPLFQSLEGHVLPLPSQTLNLFYVVSLMVGKPSSSLKDIFGDISWEAIRKVCNRSIDL